LSIQIPKRLLTQITNSSKILGLPILEQFSTLTAICIHCEENLLLPSIRFTPDCYTKAELRPYGKSVYLGNPVGVTVGKLVGFTLGLLVFVTGGLGVIINVDVGCGKTPVFMVGLKTFVSFSL
jgi:hypothetical protein